MKTKYKSPKLIHKFRRFSNSPFLLISYNLRLTKIIKGKVTKIFDEKYNIFVLLLLIKFMKLMFFI